MMQKTINGEAKPAQPAPARPDELFEYTDTKGTKHALREMSDEQLRKFYEYGCLNGQKALGEIMRLRQQLDAAYETERQVNRAVSAAEFELERRSKRVLIADAVRDAIRGQ